MSAQGDLTWALAGACCAAALASGVAVGWVIWGRAEPQQGGPAPEARQVDGSLVLERRPPVGPPSAPVHAIPKGGTEVRRVEVSIVPAPAADCPRPPEAHVDLSLVRLADGSQRVVASSPDGELGGLDIPLPAAGIMPERRPWAMGASWALRNAYGVWADRSVWRFRLGLEVNAVEGGRDAEARVRVGWEF